MRVRVIAGLMGVVAVGVLCVLLVLPTVRGAGQPVNDMIKLLKCPQGQEANCLTSASTTSSVTPATP